MTPQKFRVFIPLQPSSWQKYMFQQLYSRQYSMPYHLFGKLDSILPTIFKPLQLFCQWNLMHFQFLNSEWWFSNNLVDKIQYSSRRNSMPFQLFDRIFMSQEQLCRQNLMLKSEWMNDCELWNEVSTSADFLSIKLYFLVEISMAKFDLIWL